MFSIDIFNFLLLVCVVIILLFQFFVKKPIKSDDGLSEKLSSQILLGLNQQQTRNLMELTEQINKTSQIHSQNLFENLQKLEQRFAKLQLEMNQTISQELQKTQTILQEKLNRELQNLAELNNKNFTLLTQSNKERLDQIQISVEKRMDENLKKNLESFETVTKNLAQMQSTAQKMVDSTKSVDKLNNIFERTSVKSFGDFGEKYLENLLSETLAKDSWDKQVTIPGTSEKIDFVIRIEDKKIGIDSKFPVTKYRDYLDAPMEGKADALKEFLRSVMMMAKSIADKYNKDNFLDILLIYLPSESMYSEVVNDEKVSEYLAKIKITPTSPNNVFPLIKTLSAYQFKIKVSENAEKIIEGLKVVRKNIDSFQDEFRKLGDKLRQAQDNYDKADRNLIGVQKEVLKLEQNEELEIN